MKIISKSTKKKESYCPAYRTNNKLGVKSGASESLAISMIAKEVVTSYKESDSSISIEDTLSSVSEKVKSLGLFPIKEEVLIRELETTIGRYLRFDQRKSMLVETREFPLSNGDSILVTPDFVYKDNDTVDVISFSAGRQKMSNKILKDKEVSSMQCCPDTLGLLLYGADIVKNGVVRVCYDALTSKADSYNNFTSSYMEAAPGKSSTLSHHRVSMRWEVKDGVPVADLSEYYKALEVYKKGGCEADCDICKYNSLCNMGQDNDFSSSSETKVKSLSNTVFTKEQEAVLEFSSGVALVNAGAGSGKTNTIAYRVCNLLLDGARPEDILLVSFSNAAVGEMKKRIKAIADALDLEGTDKVVITTFNGLGDKLLKAHFGEFGYSKEPRIISEIEEYNLVLKSSEMYGEIEELNYKYPHMDFGKSKGAIKYLLSEFRRIRTFNMDEEAYLKDEKSPAFSSKVWGNYLIYKDLLKTNNLIDYSDQVNLIGDVLRSGNEDILKELDYEHIIVDEFQDSSDDQIAVLNTLLYCSKFRSMMLVGDYAQAVYGFRGTSPENILNLSDKLLDEFKVFYLTENFRNSKEILEYGEKILSVSGQATKRKCFAHKKEPGKVTPISASDMELESVLLNTISNTGKVNELTIIAHNVATLYRVKGILKMLGYKSEIIVPKSVLEDKRVKAAISLAKAFRDSEDTISLAKYVSVLETLNLEDTERSKEKIEKFKKELEGMKISLSGLPLLGNFFSLLEDLDVNEDAVYHRFLEDVKGKNFTDIDSLISYLINIEAYNLDYRVLTKPCEDTISLITAHGAKGMEWKKVLIITTDFRFDKALEPEIKELMRLLYVSVTRAEEEVVIYGTDRLLNKIG